MEKTYLAIDLKSYYASAECAARHLDPLTTNLVVAANSHFLRTAGPHFPDSQGHIKRTVRGNSRAGVSRPC